MKSNFYLILSLFVTTSIFSENSKFANPLRVEPSSIYTKIRIDASGNENRERNFYEREQNIGFEGEYKLGQYFSIKGTANGRNYDSSGSKSVRGADRYSIGLKFAKEHGDSDFRFSYGVGVKGFSRFTMEYPRSETSRDLYLVKPNLSIGIGIKNFELVGEFSVQSETNSKFKENEREEFRRHYAGGLSASYALGDNWRLFLETQYKEPYNKKIDTKVRSWDIFPGFSYKIYNNGFISASAQFQLQTENYNWDRGLRISYFHFFE